MSVPFLLALGPLLAIAALLDLRQRRIPNSVAAAVALLGGVALATTAPGALWQHALVTLLMLVAGIAIWSRGWLGGGDVKLLAALGLWAGPDHVASLLLATTLAGGFLALGMLFAGRAGASPLILFLRLHVARLLSAAGPVIPATPSGSANSLPYGLAVACGGGWLVHLLLA
jgi:prepilin peptidase CpaA